MSNQEEKDIHHARFFNTWILEELGVSSDKISFLKDD
jgi:hypothetical protein